DNRKMFITICKQGKRNYKNCDIYKTTYEKFEEKRSGKVYYQWSEFENLGKKLNGPKSWEAQPSLSGNGKRLYFATARKNSRGMDIYVTEKDSNGKWKKAKSVSDKINTDEHEKTPFIHSDSRTLYFASNGKRGAGGYDLYFARYSPDSGWTEPKNIGYPINTENDEVGLIVSANGNKAYFASNRIGNTSNYDVFKFDLPKKAKPKTIKLIKGTVRNEKGEAVTDAEVEIKNIDNKDVEKIQVSNEDGSYAAVVRAEEGDDVIMNVKKDGYTFQSSMINTGEKEEKGEGENEKEQEKAANKSNNKNDVVVEEKVEMQEMEKNKPFEINDIYYATNSAELKEDSKYILDEFIDYLKENKSLKIAIHGHTDNVGSKDDNKALSADRAFTVMEYLNNNGVPSNRLEFKGFGESKPVASNDNPKGRAENRRTEFVVLSK
ncbi:MAG: OmpA family protein, partial [Flavobacteriales bacterium]